MLGLIWNSSEEDREISNGIGCVCGFFSTHNHPNSWNWTTEVKEIWKCGGLQANACDLGGGLWIARLVENESVLESETSFRVRL